MLYQLIESRMFLRVQLKACWKEAPVSGGKLDYVKFVQIIKRGKEEEAK